MFLFNVKQDITRELLAMEELTYAYFYNINNLKEGYYFFKRRQGEEDEINAMLDQIKASTAFKTSWETKCFYVKKTGDNKEGASIPVFVREGAHAGHEYPKVFFRVIYEKCGHIRWDKINSMLTLEYMVERLTSDGWDTANVFRWENSTLCVCCVNGPCLRDIAELSKEKFHDIASNHSTFENMLKNKIL